jgi:hypothetical protein
MILSAGWYNNLRGGECYKCSTGEEVSTGGGATDDLDVPDFLWRGPPRPKPAAKRAAPIFSPEPEPALSAISHSG